MAKESTLNAVIILVPHLSYLDLSSTSCSDKTLLCIQKMCPNLITLNLQECGNVTNDGMLKLCSGSNLSLKNLNILYTSVEYTGLNDVLNGMPSLECLTYENIADSFYCIREHSVEHCIKRNIKYNLTELIYEDIGLAQNPQKVIWTWTVLCPNVTKVHILFAVDHSILELCSRFSHLTELKLEMEIDFFHTVISDPLAAFLPIANNLSTLILSHVKIPSVTLIECFKNVKNLYLKRVCFTTFGEEEIKSKYTNLDTLSIKSVNLSDTSTYNFISLLISLSKNVTKLIVSNMHYLPNELVDIIINSMKSLTFVEFNFIRTKLSSSFCRFFEIPSVQQVYLDECITSFSGPAHVAHKSNTLSWCIMNTLCDDDDGGDI